ncbi:MAG: hypothetical protein ACK55Z_36235, partial [bacterium]
GHDLVAQRPQSRTQGARRRPSWPWVPREGGRSEERSEERCAAVKHVYCARPCCSSSCAPHRASCWGPPACTLPTGYPAPRGF